MTHYGIFNVEMQFYVLVEVGHLDLKKDCLARRNITLTLTFSAKHVPEGNTEM